MAYDDDEPMLGAKWINERIDNVYERAMEIFSGILDNLTASGYLPFESPPNTNFMKRLTPEQKVQLGMEQPQEGPNSSNNMQLPLDLPTPPSNMIEALPSPPMPLAPENTAL